MNSNAPTLSRMHATDFEVGDLVEIVRRVAPITPDAVALRASWNAAHVETRREVRSAKEIAAKYGCEAYVPHELVIEVRRGRKVDARRNLLPGYILVRSPRELGRSSFTDIPGVNGMVMAGDYLAVVSDVEVERLRSIEQIVPAKPLPGVFAVDDMVRVVKGPFAPFPGTVTDVLTRGRIVVDVWVFGRATPVRFDDAKAIERI